MNDKQSPWVVKRTTMKYKIELSIGLVVIDIKSIGQRRKVTQIKSYVIPSSSNPTIVIKTALNAGNYLASQSYDRKFFSSNNFHPFLYDKYIILSLALYYNDREVVAFRLQLIGQISFVQQRSLSAAHAR